MYVRKPQYQEKLLANGLLSICGSFCCAVSSTFNQTFSYRLDNALSGRATPRSFETISLWRRRPPTTVSWPDRTGLDCTGLVSGWRRRPELTRWLVEGRDQVNDQRSVVTPWLAVPRQRVSFIWPDTDISCACRCRAAVSTRFGSVLWLLRWDNLVYPGTKGPGHALQQTNCYCCYCY